VPSAHAIKTWVNNFGETGSTVKKKGGSVKTVHTPQNIDAVRASFEQSPHWSAVEWCVFFVCSVLCFKNTDSLISANSTHTNVLSYKCNCIMISNTSNFLLTLKNCPIRWRTLYKSLILDHSKFWH
jgi:hypothetical protein